MNATRTPGEGELGSMMTFRPLMAFSQVLDLEGHVRHLADELGEGALGIISHPLDAEGIGFVVGRAGS